MKLFYFFTIILLVCNLEAKEVRNVDTLIEYALKNAPDLRITLKEHEAAIQKKEESFGYFLPKVDLHLSGGEIGSSDIPAKPDEMKQASFLLGNLSLQQLLYDFGKTSSRYDSALYEEESLKMRQLQSISDKVREVKNAYYMTLRAMALIDVAKENLKLNEAQLYRAKRYFTAGIRTKIDISDARVNVIQAKIQLKKVHYQLKSAYENLNKVLGVKTVDTKYTITPQKLNLENVFDTLVPFQLDLSQSVAYAFTHRYAIQERASLLKASQANVNGAKSQYYPALYLNADYTKQKENNELKTVIPQDQWQASLNLTWNLYRGGSSSAVIQQNIIYQEISLAQLEFLKLQIKKDVANAYINLNESKDTVELAQALLQAAKEKFVQAQKRYEHGLSDYIELQQARQGYIDAKSSLVVDYYSYYDALAGMFNVIGM